VPTTRRLKPFRFHVPGASLSSPFVDAALAKHPDRQGGDAIKLLLVTGARRGEVLPMRWGDLDLTVVTASAPVSR
jgi:hypothetical protein